MDWEGADFAISDICDTLRLMRAEPSLLKCAPDSHDTGDSSCITSVRLAAMLMTHLTALYHERVRIAAVLRTHPTALHQKCDAC